MTYKKIHILLSTFIVLVWLINGLFCKVLNLVPRHEQIVARILGYQYSRTLTLFIGLSEIAMAIWIVSGFKSRLNTLTQITIVATMNALEFFLVPDLLLWGKFNSIFALFFIAVVYINEFYFRRKSKLN
jgi:hypothetical protein